ncbi:restriction endonuclease subunit S [Vibrio mediterranei]|uniref:restriction endonuclease subunit S n=1 Tax=Vibrio mediterranei TaxID=689 RepID=UPI00148BEAF7|nr:restriction endonuclease subunit S [Vibrio mediterranei]NOI23607.1 restriction endonuclease subunit S [Vibrio mediterranei]
MSWPLVQLIDICDTTQGVQITKANTSAKPYDGGYRYLYIADFLSDNKLSYIDDKFDHKKVTLNDLVMANTGSPGKVFKGKDGILSNNLFKISFNQEIIDRDYLYFVLSSEEFQYILQSQMKGGIQKHLGHKTISQQVIPLPPLETQKQIAAALEKADQLRKDCQQMEQELNSLAQSVFIDMFGDPVTNPMSFEVTKLKDLVSVLSGATPSKSNDSFWVGDVPWVSPKDMKVPELYDAIDHVNEITFTETNLKSIPLNSILIVVRGMILAHTVPLAITRRKLAINQDIKALTVKSESITSEFLLAALSSMHAHLLGIVSTAAHGTKRIDMADLLNIKIIVPSLERQEEYIKAIQVIRELLVNQKAEAALHESNFKALMQKAFKGELNL